MKTEEFYYNLPEELIAQAPCELRDHSKMMVLDRKRNTAESMYFYEIPRFMKEGDVVVINDSKVIPAKLTGEKTTGAKIEMLLLSKKDSPQKWEVLLRPAKRVKTGTVIHFGDGFRAEITDKVSEKKWIVDFGEIPDFDDFLKKYGNAPLPPYIKRKLKSISGFRDLERYQTIYAKNPGSVAAPTAGLHFSDEIIEVLKDRGVEIVPVTLHVGYGTFLPIETEIIEDHVMEKEFFEISEESAEKINRAKTVTAVGTTSVRVLESSSDQNGKVKPGKGYTDLYIYPGYRFKKAGKILTNFHLPKSSLFLLTCAFAGTELTKTAYKKAMEEGFRFYSYGDCMLVL